MNKKELVAALADRSGITKKESEAFINEFVNVVSETLEKGEAVKLVGFGTFEVVERSERKGVNPKTKEAITIPAHKAPKFKAGTELKNRVK